MADKKKIATAAVAVTAAAALLLGGTFAWQSISQTALNEASDIVNPGGRLHDDFDGTNKDVYVENFTDPDNGGEDIYARIRLEEYFEIVMNYGTPAQSVETVVGSTVDLTDGTLPTGSNIVYDDEGNTLYERVYETKIIESVDENGVVNAAVVGGTYAEDADEGTTGYSWWNWQTGGETVYMPTFNLNKDSLAADLNGKFDGAVGVITDRDDDQYTDYVDYSLAENSSKTGTEIYDGDSNSLDEVGTDVANAANYPDNVELVENQEHTAATTTYSGTLMSMQEWIDAGSQPGPYWVYDTDGWVYWAQAIPAGETTGLLLDGIGLNQVMDDTWYYAINVVAQFVTADDVGITDNTGFYDLNAGPAPSDNAKTLLETIGVKFGDEAAGSDDAAESFNCEVTLDIPEGITVDSANFPTGTTFYSGVLTTTDGLNIGELNDTIKLSGVDQVNKFDYRVEDDNGEWVSDTVVTDSDGNTIAYLGWDVSGNTTIHPVNPGNAEFALIMFQDEFDEDGNLVELARLTISISIEDAGGGTNSGDESTVAEIKISAANGTMEPAYLIKANETYTLSATNPDGTEFDLTSGNPDGYTMGAMMLAKDGQAYEAGGQIPTSFRGEQWGVYEDRPVISLAFQYLARTDADELVVLADSGSEYYYVYAEEVHEYLQEYEYDGKTYYLFKGVGDEEICVIEVGQYVENLTATGATSIEDIDWDHMADWGVCEGHTGDYRIQVTGSEYGAIMSSEGYLSLSLVNSNGEPFSRQFDYTCSEVGLTISDEGIVTLSKSATMTSTLQAYTVQAIVDEEPLDSATIYVYDASMHELYGTVTDGTDSYYVFDHTGPQTLDEEENPIPYYYICVYKPGDDDGNGPVVRKLQYIGESNEETDDEVYDWMSEWMSYFYPMTNDKILVDVQQRLSNDTVAPVDPCPCNYYDYE